jgi:putative flippase GtrA
MGKRQRQTKGQLFWEMFRFLLVGGVATIFDYVVWYIVSEWILPPPLVGETLSTIISTALGFCVGLTVSWTFSVAFVFKHVTDKDKVKSGKSFLVFATVGLIGLLITEIGMVFAQFLPEIRIFKITVFLGKEWKWWIMKVVMTWIVLVWNYCGRKILIFK